VWDNFGLEWNYANFPVTETYDIIQNGCNISISTRSATTNSQGRFADQYGDPDGTYRILMCDQSPQCTTTTTQNITVAGVPFSHGVTWGCSDVQITRQ
jgi:hypothetical protein